MSVYTPDEVADMFKVTRVWLMRRLPELPHMRAGNYVRFSEDDVAAIRAKFHQEPKAPDTTGLAPRSATRRRRSA